VSFDATSGLRLGNEFIDFKARFGGIPRDIAVPIDHVIAIYARENGQGMAFPVPTEPSTLSASSQNAAPTSAPAPSGLRLASEPKPVKPLQANSDEPPPSIPPTGGRPSLKRIK
jgi:stringent starvation protein B